MKDAPVDPPTFASLGLDERLCAPLAALGYEAPTPIQERAIPILLSGKDVCGMAATGTGKTAAFALPLLARLARDPSTGGRRKQPRGLVLVPTRELAMQVAEAVHKYGKPLGIRALPIYGGTDIVRQLRALKDGVDVVVATPGRALDHVRRRSLVLGEIAFCVLDEADEMLDLGFAEDLTAILAELPEAPARQTALFSATMPRAIAELAKQHMHAPETIDLSRQQKAGALPAVRQVAYLVHRAQKVASLVRVLDVESPTSALVFCRTRLDVDQLTESLTGRGHAAEALHGGLSQDQRDRVMKRFRAGKTTLLVATDVAARGLDISHLSHVINFEVPYTAEDYVHRIGRTGRAGRAGTAITLVDPREHRQLRWFEQLTRQKIQVATLPTLADLKTRRLEVLRAAVREAAIAGGLDALRGVVLGLAEELDVVDVAAAALKLAQEARGGGLEDEHEIMTPALPRERESRTDAPGKKKHVHPMRAPKAGDGSAPPRRRREQPWKVARLWIGAGRRAGVRPGDLVGAIANEANLTSKSIGAVEIFDDHSLVELPEEIVDDVADVLSRTWIKGKKVTVRRDG
jgi:ATP-dependent RNA helicase DeaD